MNGDLGPAPVTADRDVYDRLIADLDASGAHYRLTEHALASEDYLRLARPRIARIIAT